MFNLILIEELATFVVGVRVLNERMIEKAKAFDKSGSIEAMIDHVLDLLRQFRSEYPFAEDPSSIEVLCPDDLFKEQPDEVGEFFRWLEFRLKEIGHLTLYGSGVYRRIRNQFGDFKELLYIVVDQKKSLAEKVDANWSQISGLGQDEHIAKKIIFCFNYEQGNVLPIFNTNHLEHFVNEIVETKSFPSPYASLGEKYAYLTSELLKVKNSVAETKLWELPYFSRFLYDNYPPSRDLAPEFSRTSATRSRGLRLTDDQKRKLEPFREFNNLLVELQTKKKISGAEFRLNQELWNDNPQDRESLVEKLRLLDK